MKDHFIKLVHAAAVAAGVYLFLAPTLGLPDFGWLQHLAGLNAAQQAAAGASAAALLLRVHTVAFDAFSALAGLWTALVAFLRALASRNPAAIAQADADLDARIQSAASTQAAQMLRAALQYMQSQGVNVNPDAAMQAAQQSKVTPPAQSGRAWLPLLIALALCAVGLLSLQGCQNLAALSGGAPAAVVPPASGASAPSMSPSAASVATWKAMCSGYAVALDAVTPKIPVMNAQGLQTVETAMALIGPVCTSAPPASVTDAMTQARQALINLQSLQQATAPAQGASK